ncbi:MAG: hypothetical protein B6244_09765 [Candidatus Cloacimonetes bacterium 4572_55]|nr:MAG: hypothetical protein B6244_09765 [Candidatus Cloacimonetes bacterium 4572_55]
MKKTTKYFLILISLVMVWTGWNCPQSSAQETDAPQNSVLTQAPIDTLAMILKEVDRLELDEWKHQEALDMLLQVESDNAENGEILWRISRQYSEVGKIAEKDQKAALYQQAIDYALRAVELDSTNANGHLHWAIAAGRLALFKGGKELIKLSKEVKYHSEKSIHLNPNEDVGYYLLGRWHRKIANIGFLKKTLVKMIYGGLPDATNEASVENMKKAIELDPDFIEYHLELGRTYAKRMKMYDEARVCFEKVLELPLRKDDDESHKAEAQEMLEKIENK